MAKICNHWWTRRKCSVRSEIESHNPKRKATATYCCSVGGWRGMVGTSGNVEGNPFSTFPYAMDGNRCAEWEKRRESQLRANWTLAAFTTESISRPCWDQIYFCLLSPFHTPAFLPFLVFIRFSPSLFGREQKLVKIKLGFVLHFHIITFTQTRPALLEIGEQPYNNFADYTITFNLRQTHRSTYTCQRVIRRLCQSQSGEHISVVWTVGKK